MSDIILSDFPQNISVESTPVFQATLFDPAQITIDYVQGSEMPHPVTVATQLEDVYGQNWFSSYVAVRYRTFIQAVQNMPVCVVMSGPLYTGETGYNNIESTGIAGDMLYTFQNLNLLQPGEYTFQARHEITGFNPYPPHTPLRIKWLQIKVRVFPSSVPIVTPQSFTFHYTLGSNNLYRSITIDGNNWVVRCPPGFSFFSNTPGITIVPYAGGGFEASGTGLKTFSLVATPALVPTPIVQNPLHYTLVVNGGVLQLPISIFFIQENGLYQSTEVLNFVAYKNFEDATPQELVLFHNQSYTISGLPWLTLSDQEGDGSAQTVCIVTPMAAANMETGTYTGVLKIKDEHEVQLGAVNVVYKVIEMLGSPYAENDTYFTLENEFLEFTSLSDEGYFDVLLKAKIFDYYALTYRERELPFKIPLFQRKQKFNISHIMHRLMADIPDFEQEQNMPYLKAHVSIQVTEKRNNNAAFSESFSLDDIYFVAGRKPAMVAGCGFLEVNSGASRVTPSGYYYLTILANSYPTLEIYKKGILENVTGLTPGLTTLHLDFNTLEAAPGDVFEYRLKPESGGAVSKFFEVFPNGYNSNFILWETDYKLKAVMEFTGKYNIKSDYENRTTTVVNNLVDELKKIKSTKSNKLSINTGFLLKDDIPAVESLARSGRAALVQGDEIIYMVPIPKSIITVDDDRELIAFEIEFEINRSHDEKIYSF